MDLRVDKTGPVWVARLTGRLDALGAPEAEPGLEALAAQAAAPVALDLSGLEFLASLGIGLILRLARGLRARGLGLALCGARGPVREVLDIAGLSSMLPTAPDPAAAAARLGGATGAAGATGAPGAG
ncbi:MAG: STAS domain-containing protein [Desulfovibrionaceae bacterium]